MGWLSVSGESLAEARFRSYKENFQVEETSSAAELAAVDSSFRLHGKSFLFMNNWGFSTRSCLTPHRYNFFDLINSFVDRLVEKTYYAATKVSTALTICTARHITYLLVHAAACHAYDTQSIIHAR